MNERKIKKTITVLTMEQALHNGKIESNRA